MSVGVLVHFSSVALYFWRDSIRIRIRIQIIFCARENVLSFNAAGPKNLEIRYVLSELLIDGFAVVLYNM